MNLQLMDFNMRLVLLQIKKELYLKQIFYRDICLTDVCLTDRT